MKSPDPSSGEPLVSVIVPARNSAGMLGRCLESLLAQSYPNFELIVVDNGLSDGSRQLVLGAAEADSRVRLLAEPRIGRGAARRAGEEAARGGIILMTDADCVVPPDWIGRLAAPIAGGQCDAVQGSEFGLASGFWSRQRQARISERDLGRPASFAIDTKNFAVSAAALSQAGFTDPSYRYCIDTELGLRLAARGSRVAFMPDIKVGHAHPGTLAEMALKQYHRARAAVRIGRERRAIAPLRFYEDSCQTFFSFAAFFPAVLAALFKRGIGYFYYELASGLAWRAGIVAGVAEGWRAPRSR